MGLLILGEPMIKYEIKGQYFGTHRVEPMYIECGEVAEINDLWDWYVHNKALKGTLRLSDIGKAKRLINVYKKIGIDFQIIELARSADTLQLGRFIGFDLSYKSGHSLLSWGLTFHSRRKGNEIKGTLRPITLLIERYFQPKLNVFGLFPDKDIATYLLDVLCTIQQYEPGCFDTNLDQFEAIALGVVEES